MNPWYIISFMGEPELWVVIAMVLVAVYFGLRHTSWRGKRDHRTREWYKRFLILFITSLLITLLATQLMKTGFQVPRECVVCPAPDCNIHCPEDFALPSGHAATIIVPFMALLISIRRRWAWPLLIVPAAVAVSRTMLLVHTWADVVAGLAVGLVVTILVWKLVLSRLAGIRL
jgi:membrane-associated phospholipid phosphatase